MPQGTEQKPLQAERNWRMPTAVPGALGFLLSRASPVSIKLHDVSVSPKQSRYRFDLCV